ncbi:zinc dependent phospholipase C family protein [Stieleria sp.]|uniref:zinc dependent phospholipase C family protein n=1 Tax=Stieleria sp. TaxID=2795976 RepID=UPI00356692A0
MTNRLHAIIRRTHCQGTHQRFAIDALPMIRSDAGKRFTAWLLYYHRSFLRGAIDPDVRFRDYQNHILHVREGYWGGAPRVAHQWYNRLQKYLRAERFRDAAHAAGVLSHYVTDMAQPLHTISTEREALIHRPLEWSVDQAYDRIRQKWHDDQINVIIQLADDPGWLGSLMMHMARHAHGHCDRLIRHYRFHDGVRDPRQGIDEHTLTSLAELFSLAITAVSLILDRAAEETESYTGYPIPECRCGWALIGATLRAPIAVWKKQVRRHVQTRSIRALAEEYFQTGSLSEWLPHEVDIKRRVIAIRHDEKRRKQTRRAAA